MTPLQLLLLLPFLAQLCTAALSIHKTILEPPKGHSLFRAPWDKNDNENSMISHLSSSRLLLNSASTEKDALARSRGSSTNGKIVRAGYADSKRPQCFPLLPPEFFSQMMLRLLSMLEFHYKRSSKSRATAPVVFFLTSPPATLTLHHDRRVYIEFESRGKVTFLYAPGKNTVDPANIHRTIAPDGIHYHRADDVHIQCLPDDTYVFNISPKVPAFASDQDGNSISINIFNAMRSGLLSDPFNALFKTRSLYGFSKFKFLRSKIRGLVSYDDIIYRCGWETKKVKARDFPKIECDDMQIAHFNAESHSYYIFHVKKDIVEGSYMLLADQNYQATLPSSYRHEDNFGHPSRHLGSSFYDIPFDQESLDTLKGTSHSTTSSRKKGPLLLTYPDQKDRRDSDSKRPTSPTSDDDHSSSTRGHMPNRRGSRSSHPRHSKDAH